MHKQEERLLRNLNVRYSDEYEKDTYYDTVQEDEKRNNNKKSYLCQSELKSSNNDMVLKKAKIVSFILVNIE